MVEKECFANCHRLKCPDFYICSDYCGEDGFEGIGKERLDELDQEQITREIDLAGTYNACQYCWIFAGREPKGIGCHFGRHFGCTNFDIHLRPKASRGGKK